MDIETALKEAMQATTDIYDSIHDYAIEIGVMSDKATRLGIDITNAELMFIHENGSPLKSIPKRPVLQLTIEKCVTEMLPETLDRIYVGCFKEEWTKDDVRKELEKLCLRMQKYARWVIYQSDLLEKNKPGTIKAKGSDRPLLDTGKLARSITCRLVRIK